MALTPEKYQKLQALLSDPEKDLSEDFRARAQAAVDAYRNDYREAAQGPLSAEMPEQYDPSKTQQVASGIRQASDEGAHALLAQLDPSYSLPAQILALQPATTHPAGDEAAESEWLTGPLDNPAGRVIFYEPPLRQVQEELLAKPELFRALQLDIEPTPEGVTSIQEGDSTYQAYADYKWKQTGEAAAQGGKTAYRYSKAPYLREGPNAHWLDTLSTKLQASGLPVVEGLTALVGGLDDAANAGLGSAAARVSELDDEGPPKLTPEEEASGRYAWHPTLGKIPKDWEKRTAAGGKAIGGGNDEVVGGTTASLPDDASTSDVAAAAEEAHPNLHTGGQLTGALMPSRWGGLAGPMWDWMMGEGAKGLVRGAAAGAAKSGLAGAAEQTVREASQAASSYADTGEAGTTVADAGERVLGAAAGSVLPGLLGGALRGAASTVTDAVKSPTGRYRGVPGRVEAHGVDVKFGKGHVMPKVIDEANAEAQRSGRHTREVFAEKLDKPLAESARKQEANIERAGKKNAAEYYGSEEGAQALPSGEVVKAALGRLRKMTTEVPDQGLKGVGKPRAENPLKEVFNANIESVSAKKAKGAIPLSMQEAQSLLSPEWQKKVSQLSSEHKGVWTSSKPDLATIYVTPRRYNAEQADDVIRQLEKSKDPHVRAVYEAALKGREKRPFKGVAGGWSKVQAEQKKGADYARERTRRVAPDPKRGAYAAVERIGRKGGQKTYEALQEAALRSPKKAENLELLRGARIAGDMNELKQWSTGGRGPSREGRGPFGLSAMGDALILRGIYPAARNVEGLPVGGAAKTARVGAVAARNAMDSPAEERAEQREKKATEGYRERAKEAGAGKRRRTRRKVRPRTRRSETSEAER
jgi:hypothetical protein